MENDRDTSLQSWEFLTLFLPRSTSVAPVVDGYVLQRGVRTSLRGGDHLDAMVAAAAKVANANKATWAPRPALRAARRRGAAAAAAADVYGAWPRAFRDFCDREAVRDLKESHCVVPKGYGLAVQVARDKQSFELPDGTVVDVSPELARSPECLFEPEPAPEAADADGDAAMADAAPAPAPADGAPAPAPADAAAAPAPAPAAAPAAAAAAAAAKPAEPPAVAALPEMIRAALERVDVDVRKDLLLNLLLTGGGSCFAGLPERLHGDVSLALSSPFKVKVVAPSKFERKFGVWIGGSILTSLGSFQQMWLSKREYDDDGPARLVEGRWD